MKRLALVTFALVLVTGALAGSPAEFGYRNWKRKSLGKMEQFPPAIALSPEGRPHIAYIDHKYTCWHAWQEGKRWRKERIDLQPDAGWFPSIAVDRYGGVHVVYRAVREEPNWHWMLVYGYRNGDGWKLIDVEAEAAGGSVAVDESGHPYLCYIGKNNSPRYAVLSGDTWEKEDLPGQIRAGEPPSIAISRAGHVHMAFADTSGKTVWVTNESGSFVSRDVAAGRASSLALDSEGNPHIAGAPERSVWYAKWNGVGFDVDTVDPEGRDPCLRLDERDRPQIAYGLHVFIGGGWVHAVVHARLRDSAWRHELVDFRRYPEDPQLFLGEEGIPHIVFRGALGRERSRLTYSVRKCVELVPSVLEARASDGIVEASVVVRNAGTKPSRSCRLKLLLSSDEVADSGDLLLEPSVKVRRIRPGRERMITLNRETSGAPAGFILAVVDSEQKIEEYDESNNTAAAPLQ